MQFAYRSRMGVEDAQTVLLNLLYKHLEGSGTYARLLFMHFSSAFNTMQPHVLARKLLNHFNLDVNFVAWIVDFLTCQSQRVRVNDFPPLALLKVVSCPLCFTFSIPMTVEASTRTGTY